MRRFVLSVASSRLQSRIEKHFLQVRATAGSIPANIWLKNGFLVPSNRHEFSNFAWQSHVQRLVLRLQVLFKPRIPDTLKEIVGSDMPEQIELQVGHLGIGDSISAGDLECQRASISLAPRRTLVCRQLSVHHRSRPHPIHRIARGEEGAKAKGRETKEEGVIFKKNLLGISPRRFFIGCLRIGGGATLWRRITRCICLSILRASRSTCQRCLDVCRRLSRVQGRLALHLFRHRALSGEGMADDRPNVTVRFRPWRNSKLFLSARRRAAAGLPALS